MTSRGAGWSRATDEELVEGCRVELPYGSRAFEALVRRYEPLVFRTCGQRLRDDEEARDAAQDVFLRVFRGLPRFRAEAGFRTWLFRIVQNVCVDRAARRARTRRAEAAGVELAPEPSRIPAPTMSSRVMVALGRLRPGDREVLLLRHVAELPVEDVAARLGIRLSAAKMRLQRATARFRALHGV